MKLSDLKDNDDFRFVGGQTAKYKIMRGTSFYLSEMQTNDHILYNVVKKNKKSLSCRVVMGSMEYVFLFDGVDNRQQNGVDCDVVVIQKIC